MRDDEDRLYNGRVEVSKKQFDSWLHVLAKTWLPHRPALQPQPTLPADASEGDRRTCGDFETHLTRNLSNSVTVPYSAAYFLDTLDILALNDTPESQAECTHRVKLCEHRLYYGDSMENLVCSLYQSPESRLP